MSVVMGVLILSFAVWGIADIFKGFGQSTLAKIGGTEISTEQFRQLYTEKLQQLGRQFGRPLTMDQARAFGLDRQVLQQTIAEAALDEEARRMGLGQSDAEIMRMIYTDPNFKGVDGKFDPARFQATIRQFGFTEQRYIAEQRRVSLRRQIAGTVSAGLEPSKVLIEALSRYQNEQRAIEYVKLDAAQAGTIDPPSPETLAASSTITRPSSAPPNTARYPSSRSRRKKSANGPRSRTRTPRNSSSCAATSLARRNSARYRKSCSRTRRKPRRRALASRRECRSTISPRNAGSNHPTSTSA